MTSIDDVQLIDSLSKQLSLKPFQVRRTIQLLHDGNTIPFIARYRKEQTGGLDEIALRNVSEHWTYAVNLAERKREVLRLVADQGKLTADLKKAVNESTKLQEVEDLYRPFRQKRRTKATIAKEKGLEPYALWMFNLPESGEMLTEAKAYLSQENGIYSVDEVIQGAKDIVAEWISDRADIRKAVRQLTFKKGKWKTVVKAADKDEKKTYEMYYDYEEAVEKIVPHRVLAANRGEKEGVLKVTIKAPVDEIILLLKRKIIRKRTIVEKQLAEAIDDSYKRLIAPSIEREIRNELTEKADDQAIHIFSENLRHLLLQPPMKGMVVLGIDPAYRTGCKLAVIDETGKMLATNVIYPIRPRARLDEAKKVVMRYIDEYNVKLIAIGNGTASRETEQFIAETIKVMDKEVKYVIVNEAGASVYSASSLAREEFPNLQVEERSAVSIARRLQDPLAELVKIDPKSIGVGQYQHDVAQKKLNDSLSFVVETTVNQVGVNVNTASASLLQYVAGLSKTVAANIVKKREEEGRFINRRQLKEVPRLGSKTYEQCIGFLRITDGDNPLDQTPIHPESYKQAEALLQLVGYRADQIGSTELQEALGKLDIQSTAQKLHMGEPTLRDMIEALIRPGRDPRDDIMKPILRSDILKMEDLQKGMRLEGTIRNVVDFGVFVDIGVKQDGLVHISKLANQYVKHPLDIVRVGEIVTVWVDDVDVEKERIALTMLHSEPQQKANT